jgi:hypothetical protein
MIVPLRESVKELNPDPKIMPISGVWEILFFIDVYALSSKVKNVGFMWYSSIVYNWKFLLYTSLSYNWKIKTEKGICDASLFFVACLKKIICIANNMMQ